MGITAKDIGKMLLRTGAIVGIAVGLYFLVELSTFTLLALIFSLALILTDMVFKTFKGKKTDIVDIALGIFFAIIIALVLFVLGVNLATPTALNWVSIIILVAVALVFMFFYELIDKLKRQAK